MYLATTEVAYISEIMLIDKHNIKNIRNVFTSEAESSLHTGPTVNLSAAATSYLPPFFPPLGFLVTVWKSSSSSSLARSILSLELDLFLALELLVG